MGHPQLNRLNLPDLEERIRGAQRGDEIAFSWLIAQTKNRLTKFLYFLSGNSELTQDLVQETYIYALENLKKLKEPVAFMRWLFLIARNRFLDHKKSPRNKPHENVQDLDRLGRFSTLSDQELWIQIRESLALLKEEEREALLLVDMEGYSYQEAAQMIGISEAALTSRLQRGRLVFYQNFPGPK